MAISSRTMIRIQSYLVEVIDCQMRQAVMTQHILQPQTWQFLEPKISVFQPFPKQFNVRSAGEHGDELGMTHFRNSFNASNLFAPSPSLNSGSFTTSHRGTYLAYGYQSYLWTTYCGTLPPHGSISTGNQWRSPYGLTLGGRKRPLPYSHLQCPWYIILEGFWFGMLEEASQQTFSSS